VYVWPSYGYQDERERSFYIEGLCNHPYVRLVEAPEMADVVFWITVQQMQPNEMSSYFMEQDFLPSLDLVPKKKLICIDQGDNMNPWGISKDGPGPIMIDRCALILKRSKVQKRDGASQFYSEKVGGQYSEPVAYPIADIAVAPLVSWEEREHPVTCTLRDHNYWNAARRKVLGWLRESLPQLGIPVDGEKVHLGEYTKTTHHEWDKGYNNLLSHTKILVTCNPATWEGDQVSSARLCLSMRDEALDHPPPTHTQLLLRLLQRTWEALAAGALVFVDKMLVIDKLPHPLEHKKHIIFYDLTDYDGVGSQRCCIVISDVLCLPSSKSCSNITLIMMTKQSELPLRGADLR
jgi:hypothetical protein